jgi:tetratricopeptide (TPR) repeat protein
MAYWFLGNVDSSLSSYHAGLEQNPNDTELMVELGFRYALLAQWDRALPLLETGYDADPFQPGTYRVALALYHLAHGRYAECLLEARRVVAPDVIYAHLLRAVSAAHLGYQEEAQAGISAILSLAPDYAKNIVSDLKARNVHPSLIRLVGAGLSKAGLEPDLSPLDRVDAVVTPPVEPTSKLPILRALRFPTR